MKIYEVGGCVRDRILGLEPKDIDFVVVGSNEDEMISRGFKKVGADFPVFLHPETGDEYALARREASTGPGYNDFSVEFGPDVTLEEDLKRRDLTMNSIAYDRENDKYIDPFGGMDDIKRRTFKIVNSSAFVEDPVRLLRLARFSAQFPAFHIAPTTLETMKTISYRDATPERVTLEMMKALKTHKPSNFFNTLLHFCNQEDFKFWFKEVWQMYKVPQPIKWHAEGCAYTHTMMVMDECARSEWNNDVTMFGCLVHDFGKGITPKEKLPSHPGHETIGVPLVDDFCDRLKITNNMRRTAKVCTKYHMHVHKADILREKTYVKVFLDTKRHFEDLEILVKVAALDNKGRISMVDEKPYIFDDMFIINMRKLKDNDKLSNRYTSAQIAIMSVEDRKNKYRQMLISVLKNR